jgi:hypothetical protein
VYEPHFSATGSTITNVTALWRSNIVVGLKIESRVGGQPCVHYVFSNPNANEIYQDASIGLRFQGRFGIIADSGGGDVDLYLGQARSLSYRGNVVTSVGGTNVQAEARFAPGQPPVIVANQSVSTVSPAAPTVTLIAQNASGIVSLWASGSNGVPYTLWSTTNLTLSDWQVLENGTVTNSPFLTPHPSASNEMWRFYRFTTP